MDLREKLIKLPRRESSGAWTQKRFDFQKHWAICKLLDLHRGGNDYVLIVEFHDDVVTLDKEQNPTSISFFQVKTKGNGKFSAADLTRRPKSQGSNERLGSILGKMFLNKVNFESETESLNFVVNRHADQTKLKDLDSHYQIQCSELSSKERSKFSKSLQEEFELDSAPSLDDLLYFQVSDLTIEHQEELTRDRISRFLENVFPGEAYSITPIYNALYAEIGRKSGNSGSLQDFQSLINEKAISRKLFGRMIHDIQSSSRESFRELGNRIWTDLSNEGVPLLRRNRFLRDWKEIPRQRFILLN